MKDLVHRGNQGMTGATSLGDRRDCAAVIKTPDVLHLSLDRMPKSGRFPSSYTYSHCESLDTSPKLFYFDLDR